MTDPNVDNWLETFPADAIEREIEELLAEIERLKEQVRRRREVMKIWRALSGGEDSVLRIDAARRQVASTRGKARQ